MNEVNIWRWLCDHVFFSSEFLMSNALIFVTFEISFWSFNLFLLYIETHETRFDSMRLQKEKPKLDRQPIFSKILKDTAVHQFTTILLLPFIYYFLTLRGRLVATGPTPDIWTICWQLLFFIFMEDAIFFWTHYLLHTKLLFRLIHQKHHTFHQPIGLTSVLAHPIEGILGNQLSVWFGVAILKEKHIFTVCLWIIIRVFQTVNAHCGYDLPWNPKNFLPYLHGGSQCHDYHHKYAQDNYGSFFTIWDRIMGTYREEHESPNRTKIE